MIKYKRVLRNGRPIVLLALLGAGYWGAKHGLLQAVAASDVNVRPYKMEYLRVAVINGEEKIASEVTEYRRRDGSTVEIDREYTPKGRLLGDVRRISLSDGVEAIVVDVTRTKSTTRLSPDRLAAEKTFWKSQADSNCVLNGEVSDATDVAGGWKAVRVVRSQGENSRMLIVRLPEFGCTIVQTSLQTRSGSTESWRTTASTRLVSFSEVDPPDALFADWMNYEEVGPSEVRKRLFNKAGISPKQCPGCFAVNERLETDYREHRP